MISNGEIRSSGRSREDWVVRDPVIPASDDLCCSLESEYDSSSSIRRDDALGLCFTVAWRFAGDLLDRPCSFSKVC